jgi:hypothetical protein
MHYDIFKQPLEIGCKVYHCEYGLKGIIIKHTPKMVTVKHINWDKPSNYSPHSLIRIQEQLDFAKEKWPENYI